MDSSSSSRKYDVYLSFGEDTRRNLVDHLYAALQQRGIHTYKDDETGDDVIRSIKESTLFIIVFSKGYASSSRCLDELVKIMELQKITDQTAFHVLYDVEPSEIRKQSGAFGEAFAKHSKVEAVGKWRQALHDAADLTGWDLRNGDEANKVVYQIVDEISMEIQSIYLSKKDDIVGMESRIKDVLSSLETGFGDVCMIGLTGMGGIGKTTLARAVYDRISLRFEGQSFLANVREHSKASSSGLKQLQEELLMRLLKDKDITISNVYEGRNMIKSKLGDRKVLVVLDDVDNIEQLAALAGAADWFGKGSIIIITTRDEQLLLAHGVKKIHHVDVLSEEEAILLFNLKAFGRDIPDQGYEQVSLEVVRYAAGLPLTIRVLGSFLCGKDKLEWLDAVERLKAIPLTESMQKLELSFNSLDDHEKEIFLDVACFMKGFRKDDAIRILESCGFHARIGLKVLKQKSLLTISNERLSMHDLLEEMGMQIVRQQDPYTPNRHSRLWIREEIEDILANDLGSKATRCIGLPELQLSPDILINGLGNMKKLRCLIVESETDNTDRFCDWKFDEGREYFPNALRFMRWVDYPVWCLPNTFRADNLVTLEMPCSRITHLWEGGEGKVLHNLQYLDLSYSNLETLDLGRIPNLKWLELRECRVLVKLHTPVGSVKSLVHLNLVGCSRFNSYSYVKHLESMEVLSLSKLHLIAKSLKETPRYANNNLPILGFTCLYMEKLPSSIGNREKFVSLNLQPCTKLESVSGSICGIQHLRHLTFNGCIPEVPEDLDKLAYLEKLNLLSTHIKCLPHSICMLEHLKSLKIKSCQLLEKLPEGLGRLQSLEKLTLSSTCINRLPDSICLLKHLKSLKLKSCSLLEKLPENIGQLECLEKLTLLSTRITCLPGSICMLKHLKSLHISCGLLQKLPKDLGLMESLEKLILNKCISLEDIPSSVCEMNNLKCFLLPDCVLVRELPAKIGRMKCLGELNVKGTNITRLPRSISLLKGLLIVGSAALLRSCGLASEVQTFEGETFCYIHPGENTLSPNVIYVE